MPSSTEYVYILCNYSGYLSEIKQYGPIVHPAKVKKSEAISMMLAGAPVIIYDPATKNSYPLTIGNMNDTTNQVHHSVEKPIEETVLKGAPKGAGNLGLDVDNTPEPKVQINIQEVVDSQAESDVTTDTAPESDYVAPVSELIENPDLKESDVKWNKYTKSERRQIKNYLATLKTATESNNEVVE